jgi:hypothetical protein
MTLINIKLVLSTDSFDLLNVTEDCLFISKADFNSKNFIRSTFLFEHVMFSFMVLSIMTFHVILLADATCLFPGF